MGQSTIKKQRRAAKVQTPPPPGKRTLPRRRLYLLLAAVGAALAAVAVLVAVTSRGSSEPPQALTGAADSIAVFAGVPQARTTLGSDSAPVTLAVYADPQCPYCKDWDTQTMPTLVDRYVRPGKLRIEFRGLSFVGPDSERGLRALLAAGEQNRFFQAAALLYQQQGTENTGWLDDRFVDSLAASLPGLDTKRLDTDMHSPAVDRQIKQAAGQAQQDGVDSTPTILVGKTGGELRPVELGRLDPKGTTPAIDRALAEMQTR